MSTAPPAAEPATPEPRPLTGGAVMSAASRAIVAVTGAATTILIARLLGPEGSGTFFVAQSLVLLLTVLGSLGIEHGITYYVSSRAWAPRPALWSVLRLAAVAGVMAAALGLVARVALPEAFGGLSVPLTAVVVASLPFALACLYVMYIAVATDRYEAYVAPPAAQSLLMMALAGSGAIALGIDGAVVGLAVAGVLVAIAAVTWAARRLPHAAAPDEPAMLRRAVSFGIKGYAANALQMVNYRLDLFILSASASAVALGQYSVAVAVASVMWLLPQALSDVLFPRVAHLSALHNEAAASHREMVEVKSLRHVALASFVVAVVLALALVVLVVPIYGEEFRRSISLGLILLPGAALLGVAGVLMATIVGRGRPVYSLYLNLATTPLTIALYATLIPSLGATGAALASSCSYAASFAGACLFYRRATGRSPIPLLRPTRAELADLRAVRGAVVQRFGRRSD